VKKALNSRLNFELTAVKIVDRARAPRDYQEKFMPRELALWPQLHHANLIRFMDYFEDSSRVYMVSHEVLSLTYKTLQSQKPSYLYSLLNLQTNTSTPSSTVITLQRPPVNARLKITDRSFTYHAPALWNSLPKDLRYPLNQTSSTNLSHTTNNQLLALSPSQFHSKLKTHLFLQSFPP